MTPYSTLVSWKSIGSFLLVFSLTVGMEPDSSTARAPTPTVQSRRESSETSATTIYFSWYSRFVKSKLAKNFSMTTGPILISKKNSSLSPLSKIWSLIMSNSKLKKFRRPLSSRRETFWSSKRGLSWRRNKLFLKPLTPLKPLKLWIMLWNQRCPESKEASHKTRQQKSDIHK